MKAGALSQFLHVRLLRLHVATWLVALCVAFVMLLLNWGGTRDGIAWLKNPQCVRCAHGWPAAYLIREYPSVLADGSNLPSFEKAYRGLHCLDVWTLTDHVSSVRPLWLLLDVLVAIAIVSAFSGAAELWCRRRLLPLQYTLRHLLALFLVAALALG